MSTRLTNTHTARGFSDLDHVFAQKQCILCLTLRHGCLTLLYVTSIRDFFCSWNNRALLGCRLPASCLREASRWQLYFCDVVANFTLPFLFLFLSSSEQIRRVARVSVGSCSRIWLERVSGGIYLKTNFCSYRF